MVPLFLKTARPRDYRTTKDEANASHVTSRSAPKVKVNISPGEGMMFENPMAAKITTLLATRLLLLVGAGVLQRKASGLTTVGLLIGSVALVFSSLATFSIILGVGPFRALPNLTHLVQTLEVGGWICFSASFLALAIARRKAPQNNTSEDIRR